MVERDTDVRIGKFTVRRRLGRGGMGAVYEGYDPTLDRRVAIKTLTSEAIADPESRERFEREARAAAKFSHPNIVTLYELGNFGGKEKPYIVMEYLEGTDLTSLLGRDGLPVAEALDVAIQLCRALDYAHQKGVVHRDIKPSNLRYLDDGQVKIMDFGIARVEGSHQITKSGVMMGTLHYMSPEQIRGERLDGRTDIFSAGCILYEMLAGSRPFPGDSATSILYNIVHEEPAPVVSKNPELPQEVQSILDRALAKKPEDRFQTAGEMARELEKILSIYRKTLPRASVGLQASVDAIEALVREGKWADVVKEAKALLERHPQLDEVRRQLRKALRELNEEDLERKQSEQEKTRHLSEIYQEITELYGGDATRRRDPGDRTLSDETHAVPAGTISIAKAPPGETENRPSSAVRALAAPIWALVVVALLGIGAALYWAATREPPGPAVVQHTLRVFSEPPGAAVLVNGRPTGLTTAEGGVALSLSGRESDTLLVAAELEGFEPASSEVRLGEEPPAPVTFVLSPEVRRLRLATAPPGASVTVDGEAVDGVTPVEVEVAVSGEHEIVFSMAEHESRSIRLAEGQSLPDEPIALTPRGRPGTVAVESEYPVSIHRGNGRLAGASRSPNVRLRPGAYQLRLVAPEVFLNRSVAVTVQEGETTVARTPPLGRVNVRANPGNCSVTISGFEAGAPPFMNREIAEGTHEFVFTWPGGVRDVQRVEVRADQPTYVIGQRP